LNFSPILSVADASYLWGFFINRGLGMMKMRKPNASSGLRLCKKGEALTPEVVDQLRNE
jgi:hypothetical protein